MATHDYVLANQSGSSFRSDLNNALAAIVSSNSSATEPATTYAYQYWIDTSASPAIIKQRNATNDAWFEVRQVGSTGKFDDGTEALPSIAFNNDTDTGLYRPTTDQIAISGGGAELARLNSTGLGVGTNNPQTPLHVSASSPIIRSADSDGTNQYAEFAQIATQLLISSRNDASNGAIIFRGLGGGTPDEYARFTSAGRFYINRTTGNVELDVEGQVRASTGILFGTDTAAANTLDDYEEGTFTPSFQAGSWTYTNQLGYYTKVGNTVTVWLSISWSARPTGNNLNINLPFTSATGVEQSGTISDNGQYNIGAADVQLGCGVASGSSNLTVVVQRDGLSRLTGSSTDFQSPSTFTASISYQV